KRTLDTHNIKYEYRQLGVDFEREEILSEFPEARTFPQIVINGQKIGGYEQMIRYIEDTGYTGTGHSL
ncbi:glutaredoxin, partial [Vibrio sp.]|uniref:glutaredoxin n=1 Tax=Vibrio sp. TaxID=678 RepID=UPI00311F2537